MNMLIKSYSILNYNLLSFLCFVWSLRRLQGTWEGLQQRVRPAWRLARPHGRRTLRLAPVPRRSERLLLGERRPGGTPLATVAARAVAACVSGLAGGTRIRIAARPR